MHVNLWARMTDETDVAPLLARIAAADEKALEALRIELTGKSSPLAESMRALGALPPAERTARGQALNVFKRTLEKALSDRASALAEAALEARLLAETFDVTLPAAPADYGSLHPVSQVMHEAERYFSALGFARAEGPDIESEANNFDLLNIGPDHPARGMHDTFYLPAEEGEPRRLLRTHTSPVQIRAMLQHGAPLRIIAPGRTYRRDSDATHTPMFHQIEGLVIEPGIHIGHLKHTLSAFFRFFFADDRLKTVFRTSYFPFTEPSFEVDIVRDGRVLEVAGAGMVHPNVLQNTGIDPETHQGFAFGMGLDRLAMLKYGIGDLRSLFEGDLRCDIHRRPASFF